MRAWKGLIPHNYQNSSNSEICPQLSADRSFDLSEIVPIVTGQVECDGLMEWGGLFGSNTRMHNGTKGLRVRVLRAGATGGRCTEFLSFALGSFVVTALVLGCPTAGLRTVPGMR